MNRKMSASKHLSGWCTAQSIMWVPVLTIRITGA